MGFILNNKVSQAGNGNGGFLNLNVSSGPSYPIPTTGLVGWYDANKTSSLLLNDSDGNPVASGTDGGYINTWNNSFTGTGALEAMTNPYGGSQDVYSSAQRFGINQLTGSYHPAIGGNSNLNLNLSTSSYWTWFYVVPISTTTDATVLQVSDQQTYYGNSITQSSGAYPAAGSGLKKGGILSVGNQYINGSNTYSFAQGGYLNNAVASTVYYEAVNPPLGYKTDGYAEGATFVDLQSNIKSIGLIDYPWAYLTFGFGYGPIGEFIIYNTKVSATDVQTVLQYLLTKWA